MIESSSGFGMNLHRDLQNFKQIQKWQSASLPSFLKWKQSPLNLARTEYNLLYLQLEGLPNRFHINAFCFMIWLRQSIIKWLVLATLANMMAVNDAYEVKINFNIKTSSNSKIKTRHTKNLKLWRNQIHKDHCFKWSNFSNWAKLRFWIRAFFWEPGFWIQMSAASLQSLPEVLTEFRKILVAITFTQREWSTWTRMQILKILLILLH